MKNKCPVCGSKKLYDSFKLENIPFSVNILYDAEEQASSSRGGTQDVCICERCGFVFNRAFDEKNIDYGEEYRSRSAASEYYLNYIRRSLELINSATPLKGKRMLEVGSNTGDFMRSALEFKPAAYIGVDPNADEKAKEGSDKIIIRREYFDDEYIIKYPEHNDIIISIHVIEHLENPLQLLSMFSRVLENGGILYLETPRLDWILENKTFYDFSYEHCSYFTDSFIRRLLKAAGFSVIQMNTAYEGQYFAILARKTGNVCKIENTNPRETERLKIEFKAFEKAWENAVKNLAEAEPLYLWGTSMKGVMCANILDSSKIAGLIDINPFKQGKFIPGTAYRVLSPSEISYDKVKNIAVMNDVYMNEIKRAVKKIDSRIRVCAFSDIILR